MVFRHLWGWSIPPRAEEWGSLLPLSPYTEGRVKAPGWVQLSHHTALSLLLCSQPCLFSPTSMNKIPVSELQTPEYCLGNGWQSIFIFSGTGTQTAQMDLKPNFRHNLYCFLFRTPGAFKTGEEQIPEDFIPDSCDTATAKPWEYRWTTSLSASWEEVYWHWWQGFNQDMQVVGTRKYTESFNFKCWKQRVGYSAHSSVSTKNQSMPRRILYTSLADTTSETNYHLPIIHKEILTRKAC